jgi:tartrate-resistant acid phosphatase type 5
MPEQRGNAAHSMLPDVTLLLLVALATGIDLSHGDVLRFAVAGDTGSGSDRVARGIAAVHKETRLDAIVLTGDNFYPCGVTSERDPRWSLNAGLTSVGVPVFPVLGNHDSCGKGDPDAQIRATGLVTNWRFPARQYQLRTRFADFVFLDTTPVARGQSNEAAPAIRELAGSQKPWQIAVGHHPIVSSGYHGYFPREEVRRMRALVPAVRAAGIDLYICGHDHHLELLRGRMLLLVSGAGSDPIPPVLLHLTTVFPEQIRRETIGFAVVEITRDEIRVRFYDGAGKPKSGWISGRVRR